MNKLFFVLIMLLIFFLIELYAFQAFKELVARSSAQIQQTVKFIYWGFTILVFSAFVFYHLGEPDLLGRHARTFLISFIFINYLFKSILSIFLLITDLIRVVQWLAWKLAGPDMKISEGGISRSRFLIGTGMLVAAAPVLSMSWGIFSGAHNYRVHRKKVFIKGLDPDLEGFKLLQLSDIHSGSFWDRNAVKAGVRMVMEEAADLIVFTGDLVNNKAEEMDRWKEVFGQIDAPLGVYSTLGNHDYGDYANWESEAAKEANLQQLKKTHADMGWQLLNNENRLIQHKGKSINLIGVENWSAKARFPKYGNLKKASEQLDPDLPTILLSHDPSHWQAEVIKDFPWIDLTLSGHTHGMQFGVEIPGFKWSPVQYLYEQWAGLYREGNQNLYVNRGFGYIGYPGRFGILPEITVLEFKREA